jgi:hypothetical protein
MSLRSEIPAILLVAVPFAAIEVLKQLYPELALNIVIFLIGFFLATFPIYAFTVYWAFSVRRALSVPIYKRQAGGTGALALTIWASLYLTFVLSGFSDLRLSDGAVVFAFTVPLLAFFYFCDVTMSAARRADPLLRDTLGWSKLRIPLWIIISVSFGIIYVWTGYAIVDNNLILLNQLNLDAFPSVIMNLAFNYLILLPFVGIIFVMGAVIRTKWDKVLRRHLIWVTIALILLFYGFNINIPGTYVIVFLLVSYSLYRAARSLVSVDRVPKLETDSVEAAPRAAA